MTEYWAQFAGLAWVMVVRMMCKAVRHFQPMCIHKFRIRQDLPRRTIRNDSSAIEQQDSLTSFTDHFQVVSGNHLGNMQAVHQADELAPAARVQMSGRLIQQQDFGSHGQDAG